MFLSVRVCVCACVHVCVFQHPNDSSVNGMLTGYRLYYRELPVNASALGQAEAQATGNNTSVLFTSMYVAESVCLFVCLFCSAAGFRQNLHSPQD